jgi:hypothetical protein
LNYYCITSTKIRHICFHLLIVEHFNDVVHNYSILVITER